MLVSQAWNGGHVVVTNHSCESWTSFVCKALFRLYLMGFCADTNNVTIQYSKTATAQNGNGAVGRIGYSELIPILTPEYLLPSQRIPVLPPTYSLPLRSEYLFTLRQSVARNIFGNRWRAASLRYRNRAEIAVLMCQPVLDIQTFR